MRKLAVAALVMAFVPAPAAAAEKGVLRGEVLNGTCYGPCMVGQEYPPYTGEGLRVGVRRASSGELVKLLHPTDGRFRLSLPGGQYRVRASVEGQAGPGSYNCWQGDTAVVRVTSGKVTAAEMTVANTCIV